MAVLEFVGMLIAAASGVASGVMNANAQEDANSTNLFYQQQERGDTLKQNSDVMAANEKTRLFNEKEAKLNRTERTEQKTYDRLQNAANIYTRILNENKTLQSASLTPIMSRGK